MQTQPTKASFNGSRAYTKRQERAHRTRLQREYRALKAAQLDGTMAFDDNPEAKVARLNKLAEIFEVPVPFDFQREEAQAHLVDHINEKHGVRS